MRYALICLALVGSFGCAQRPQTPRPRDELFAEKQNLNGLFMSEKTHKRIIAPKSKGMFKDEETGEICWAALQCVNPECPGKTPKEPYLFITSDVAKYNGCPACAKKRDYAKDTDAQKAANLKFIKPYDLPETEARIKEIDAEIKRSFEWEQSGKK